ncbi:MAG: gliding motility-associated C-terminal domain-containing protein, partial [Ferruginibacter sp.]
KTVATHVYNTAGIYQPTLMVTDSSGCSSFAGLPTTIKIRPNPVITITAGSARLCRGQSTTLVATGGISYAWSPASSLSNTAISSPITKPDSTITYSLTVKDDIGCTNIAKATLTVVQKMKVTVNADTAVCLGNSVQLNAGGTDAYQWINTTTGLSSVSINNPIAQPTSTVTYTVKGGDAYNCFSDTAQVNVKVLPLPTVSIAPVPDVLLGTALPMNAINSSDVTQWLWSPSDYLSCVNCPSPVSTPLAALNYQLTVTNMNGCKATANVQLKLQCDAGKVFIPAAFTPNDDGLNDIFCIKGISLVKHLIIYSRWGKPVYERSNFIASSRLTGWDGRYKNELQPSGAYTYFAEMECPTGGSFFRKGTVMLVR